MRKLPALSAMKVFEVVGQTRSFTRAADRLNLTQSAVSRQVRNLEEQLGETLVIRKHHHLELTPSGVELLATLQQAFHNVELAVRGIMEKSNQRRLRINVPPTFAKRWLMPRLASLRAFMPDIEISITTELQDSLAERSILDCAIRFGDGDASAAFKAGRPTDRSVRPDISACSGLGRPALPDLAALAGCGRSQPHQHPWRAGIRPARHGR